jgi:hypothetical protein
MALQLGALRDALIELAGYEREFADIKADLRVLKWSQAAVFCRRVGGVVEALLTMKESMPSTGREVGESGNG